MRISKGILSFETLRAARTRGVQASDRNLTRFARSKAFIPSVYKRQYACQRLKSALAASSSSVGASPPSSSSLPAPVLSCRQVRRSFSGADLVAGKADEAVGLSPGNEDNAASCPRCPEKPCCLLYTEGMRGIFPGVHAAGRQDPDSFRLQRKPKGKRSFPFGNPFGWGKQGRGAVFRPSPVSSGLSAGCGSDSGSRSGFGSGCGSHSDSRSGSDCGSSHSGSGSDSGSSWRVPPFFFGIAGYSARKRAGTFRKSQKSPGNSRKKQLTSAVPPAILTRQNKEGRCIRLTSRVTQRGQER